VGQARPARQQGSQAANQPGLMRRTLPQQTALPLRSLPFHLSAALPGAHSSACAGSPCRVPCLGYASRCRSQLPSGQTCFSCPVMSSPKLSQVSPSCWLPLWQRLCTRHGQHCLAAAGAMRHSRGARAGACPAGAMAISALPASCLHCCWPTGSFAPLTNPDPALALPSFALSVEGEGDASVDYWKAWFAHPSTKICARLSSAAALSAVGSKIDLPCRGAGAPPPLLLMTRDADVDTDAADAAPRACAASISPPLWPPLAHLITSLHCRCCCCCCHCCCPVCRQPAHIPHRQLPGNLCD
jgi:hypothetical protein